jgi:hypothetical protein
VTEDLAKRRLERRLGRARADLVALPDLMAELARCRTERLPDDGSNRHGKPGSRPPMRLDVLHLVDDRRKPGWEGDDPRLVRLSERYGVAPLLETWTRVLAEELPEYPDLAEHATVRSEAAVLVEHWDWIADQQWANELADDVITVAGWVRVSLAIRPEPKFRCPTCANRAYLVVGGFLTCSEGHEQSIRDLEMQQRRRPPMTTKEVCDEYQITPGRLFTWRNRKRITPIEAEGEPLKWLPWDVLCLVNPDIAAALDERDQLEQETPA